MPAGALRQPRALVLSPEDRMVVVKRLARSLLRFQDCFLDKEGSPAGLLCQVWLPEVTDEREIVLKTKDMPFCVAGLGDLLALFRCISCRFAFGTDIKRVAQLGAPGRVFTSSEPELTCNVQKYSKTAYLRKAEAEQCQVQSTLLIPVFLSPERHGCVAVLEVVQTSEDMHFTQVADLVAKMLEKSHLYTCTRESIERQLPFATTSTTVLLPPSVDILHAPKGTTSEDSGGQAHSSDAVPMADNGVMRAAARDSAGGSNSGSGPASRQEGQPGERGGGGAPPGKGALAAVDQPSRKGESRGGGASATAGAGAGAGPSKREAQRAQQRKEDAQTMQEDDFSGLEEDDSGDEEGDDHAGNEQSRSADNRSGGGGSTGRRRGKGSGNPGKPGVRLSLGDLQSQFGVGLKEAAARLGICPTTLKRACRRHGIQRWPRRQLQKVNQALDRMETASQAALLQAQQAQETAKNTQHAEQGQGMQMAQQLHHSVSFGGAMPGPDTRWTTLAEFIPAFQQTLQYEERLGGGEAGSSEALLQVDPPLAVGAVGAPSWGGGVLLAPALSRSRGGSGPAVVDLQGGRGSSGSMPSPLIPPQYLAHHVQHAQHAQQQQQQQQGAPAGMPQGAPGGGHGLGLGLGWGLGGLGSGGIQFVGEGAGLAGVSPFNLPTQQAAEGSMLRGVDALGKGGQANTADVAALHRQEPPSMQGARGGVGGHGAPFLPPVRPDGGGSRLPGPMDSWQFPATPLSLMEMELGKVGRAGEDHLRDDDVGFLDSTMLEMLLQEDMGRGGGGTSRPFNSLGPAGDTAAHGMCASGGLGSLKFR